MDSARQYLLLTVTLRGYGLLYGSLDLRFTAFKAVPLQAWSDAEGSRKLRLPDCMTTAQDGGKVVTLTHRTLLPPGNVLGTHFCWRLIGLRH